MNKEKTLRALSALAKILGLLAGFDQIPFIPPNYGVLIILVASTAKDSLRSLGDILDDGKKNGSFVALLLCAGLCLWSGCSGFDSRQRDVSFFQPDGKTLARTETETRVKAKTFWDAKSQLANFSASQSDKTQATKVGALNGTSSGTNALAVLDRIENIVKALPR